MKHRIDGLFKRVCLFIAGLGLAWAVSGSAIAQLAPATDMKIVRHTGSSSGTFGPAGSSGSTVACMNLGNQVVSGVSCTPQFQMLRSDGTITARAPDRLLVCRPGRGTAYVANAQVVTAPFTLQPAGQDGDSVICRAESRFGGQRGGDDYPFTDARYHWTMSASTGSTTFDSTWVPIYDALTDVITHTAGATRSYDLMANDQAGRASPPRAFDPANPTAWRGGQICVRGLMAEGYETDQADPAALTYHSSVFTGTVELVTAPGDRRPSSAILPLGVVFNRNGMITIPATLPPGDYDLFYNFTPNEWGMTPLPDGYTLDGTFTMSGCEGGGDFAPVRLRVVAPAPASVPTLEFGALIALGALVGAAGLRRQRRRG